MALPSRQIGLVRFDRHSVLSSDVRDAETISNGRHGLTVAPDRPSPICLIEHPRYRRLPPTRLIVFAFAPPRHVPRQARGWRPLVSAAHTRRFQKSRWRGRPFHFISTI
ncbi:hypothetical protein EVAR_61743_1 [Eumeta japonica]|uniref:Uncharacterized protein n=1 Tax=Eumeta variegata TaxID=151549 RepID=A0A4C1YLP4_EUMVA|nr:hypothetical protein EVAR_61743_1 [Eumeta japonica]